MNSRTSIRLLLAFLVSLSAVAIPYWRIPYHSLNLPDALMGIGMWVLFLSSLLLWAGSIGAPWPTMLTLASVMPLTVFARMIADTAKDPTSHNLWPLEVAIAAIAGVACAGAGAIVGALFARTIDFLMRKERHERS